jgi:type II secretory pathway pseudopilin PulG
MPTGERGPRPGKQRGYTYLGLLGLLTIMGAALATLGTHWSTAAQRQREAELVFRGEQIRDAIGRYRAAQNPPQWPPSLQALLEDRRGNSVRHHLRRLYADPFTGQADWALVEAPSRAGSRAGGLPSPQLMGVYSRSNVKRLRQDLPPLDGDEPKVSDWRFVHTPGPGSGSTADRTTDGSSRTTGRSPP